MRKPTKRQRFQSVLDARGWALIGRREWGRLRGELPDVSEASLREWLHEAGLPVEQPFRGVRTKSLAELEESLIAMTDLYVQDASVRQTCRQLVIEAKDRARFAAKNPKVEEEKRLAKEEMVQWLLVWLDDPAMFPAWAMLRRCHFAAPDSIR